VLKEFKEFAMRGNVVDMAVGIIIGAAFGKIVSSIVEDVIMPPIGLLLGKVNFSNLYLNLSGTAYATLDEAVKAGAPVIKYGAFLNVLINFIIVAFVLFLLIKQMNRMRAPAPATVPTAKDCPMCATSIPLAAKRCPNCTSEVRAA
jgi:large conductance mechanosensitive channel